VVSIPKPQLEGFGFTTQFLREVQTKGHQQVKKKFIIIELKRIGFTTQFFTEVQTKRNKQVKNNNSMIKSENR
jgi:hypothetical protein